jgi:hypothetical protein
MKVWCLLVCPNRERSYTQGLTDWVNIQKNSAYHSVTKTGPLCFHTFHIIIKPDLCTLSVSLILVSCYAYASTLKMEAICSSGTSVDSHRTDSRYILENRTLPDHRCENLIPTAVHLVSEPTYRGQGCRAKLRKIAVVRSEKLVADAGDSSGTHRMGSVRRWKPIPSND